jgi:hypothetical protein
MFAAARGSTMSGNAIGTMRASSPRAHFIAIPTIY